MDINKVYSILSYIHVDDDIRQDIVLKVYMAREQYDESVASLSAWVTAIAKNHIIDVSRSAEFKRGNLTSPISHFDINGEYSSIDAYLADKEPNPLEHIIAQEEKDNALKRVYELPVTQRDVMLTHLYKEEVSRPALFRARLALKQNKKEKRFKLINTKTKKEYFVKTHAEASKIADVTAQTVTNAVMKNGLFKNNLWKIVVL